MTAEPPGPPAPTGTGDLAAVLDDIRKRWECWGDGNDVPRLLAAVDAVLALHQPADGRAPGYVYSCSECRTEGEVTGRTVAVLWPCPTVRAVSAALLGTEAHDA